MNEKDVIERRAENLKAMRSPGGLALAGCTLVALLIAFVFYDHPITDDPVLVTHLGRAVSSTVE